MNNFKDLGILSTNAVVANLYAYIGRENPLELIYSLDHPAGRLKNSDLVADGPGQYQKPFSHSKGAYEPNKSPKEIEDETFITEIAEILNKHGDKFNNFVIFAPGHLQGVLKKKISNATADKVLHFIDKDYTKIAEDVLRKNVIELLSPQ